MKSATSCPSGNGTWRRRSPTAAQSSQYGERNSVGPETARMVMEALADRVSEAALEAGLIAAATVPCSEPACAPAAFPSQPRAASARR